MKPASVYEHPALLEFQARTNAQTIVDQQKHHAEETSRLHQDYQRQLKEKNEQIDLLNKAIAHLAKSRDDERRGHRELQQKLESAVIADPRRPGHKTTLWTVIEAGEFVHGRCPNCEELSCSGCGGYVLGDEEMYEGARWER